MAAKRTERAKQWVRETGASGRKERPRWSDVKRAVKEWERAELLGLLRDLFQRSTENRDFLAARVLPETAGRVAAEGYRRRIIKAFYPRGAQPADRPAFAEARRAIRDYRKAAADPPGTLDLMIMYVETGTRYTLEFGDIDGPFYDSLCSMLQMIEREMKANGGREIYERFRPRLLDLVDRAGPLAWGYGDYLSDTVGELEDTFSDGNGAMKEPGGAAAEPPGGAASGVYELRVELLDITPRIWRRFEISSDATLDTLHVALQAVMGWENAHLHQFHAKDGRRFKPPSPFGDDPFDMDDTLNSEDYKLRDLDRELKEKIVYEYDFGDSWMHAVHLVKVRPAGSTKVAPRCLAGKNACPPRRLRRPAGLRPHARRPPRPGPRGARAHARLARRGVRPRGVRHRRGEPPAEEDAPMNPAPG